MSIRRISQFSSVKLRIGIIIICLLTSLVSRYINFNWFILCMFSFYILFMILNDLLFPIKYFPVVIGVGMIAIGTFLIEYQPMYLFELRTTSSYSGSFPLIIGYYLTFLMVLEIADRRYSNVRETLIHKNKFKEFSLDILGIGLLFIISIMFVRIIMISNPCFVSHIDRYTFKRLYINRYLLWKELDDWFIYFTPILAINWKRNRKKITIITIIIYFIYLLWMGAKYGEYSRFGFLWMLAVLPKFQNHKKKPFNWKILFSCMIIVFCVLYIAYTIVQQRDFISGFSERIAQQGQLWWSIYTQQGGNSMHLNEIGDELSCFTDQGTSTPYYGIYKIMYLCAPKDVITVKIATGSTYTEATAASIYYYFGEYLGPIILILFAIIIGCIFSFLAHIYAGYVAQGRIVEVFLTARLIIRFQTFYSMADIVSIFGSVSIISIVILVFLNLKHKNKYKIPGIASNNLVFKEGI